MADALAKSKKRRRKAADKGVGVSAKRVPPPLRVAAKADSEDFRRDLGFSVLFGLRKEKTFILSSRRKSGAKGNCLPVWR